MHKDFNYWKQQHDSNALKEFNTDQEGLLWLKLKSIVRRGIIDEFLENNHIKLTSTRLNEQFQELFCYLLSDVVQSHTCLNEYILSKNAAILGDLNIDNLVVELYKVDTFKWGADNQNDLGKYLVKRYIKDNRSYDYLIQHIENEVLKTVQDYLICSWYNHWSSILIEHIFKTHNIVLPTVGQIKSVDFFINEIPFDLKVTYLPVNFIEEQRRAFGLRPELTFLKQKARELHINFDTNDSHLYYSLSERLKDRNTEEASAALNAIKEFRIQLVNTVKSNHKLLAKNLYERQSDFRFGAENRIFLILVDTGNFDDSWKLKRNIDLLKPKIHDYLDSFSRKALSDLELSFSKAGKSYEVLTDVVIIEKE